MNAFFHRSIQHRQNRQRSTSFPRGMTLIELMISITLGLVLSGAVASLYLATKQNEQKAESVSNMNENARLALQKIGRDLQMAGYYPSSTPNVIGANFRGIYKNNLIPGTPASLNNGLFGCNQGFIDPSTLTCTNDPKNSDGIVVSYFSEDNFGAGSRFGLQKDCLGQDVYTGLTPYNQAQLALNMPVQIVNMYSLVDQTVTLNGQPITTRALACMGNGNPAGSYVEIASGIEDMQITYGVSANALDQTPIHFINATAITVPADWANVVAVKVCLLARSLENSRQTSATSYIDCQGNTQTPTNNLFTFRRFEQIFAIRNHLNRDVR